MRPLFGIYSGQIADLLAYLTIWLVPSVHSVIRICYTLGEFNKTKISYVPQRRHIMKFIKYTQPDFDDYYALVSNMEVMKQITERAVPEQEARTQFESMLEFNERSTCGHYRVYSEDGAGVAYAKLIPDQEDPTKAEIGYMILLNIGAKVKAHP